MLFWLITLAISAFACLFLFWLFKRDVVVAENSQHLRIKRNVELYQQRLAHAQAELSKNFIEPEDYALLEVELGKQLLQDVEQLHSATEKTQQRQKWLLFFLPLPLLAFVLYHLLGAWSDWQITQQLKQLAAVTSEQAYLQQSAQLSKAIKQRLEQRPDNISYRLMLADYAMEQQNYTDASVHYGVVAELMPDDDEVLARFAQAEYFRNQKKLNSTVAQTIDRVLRINPNNRTILGLQGISAIETGDYQTAINAWQKLLKSLPAQSPDAQIIQQGIDNIRQKYHLPESTAAIDASQSLQLYITVDDSLQKLDQSLTVFVYARAAQGPAIPLAAEKLQLSDLPKTIVLDDSKAMMAQMTLSQHDTVIAGARISFSGEAIARDGDYQVESQPINWHTQPQLNLTIKERLQR